MGCHGVRRSLVVLGLVVLAATAAFAQAQSGTGEYVPQEGQAGKDVIWLPTAGTVVDKMLDLAEVTAQDYLIDLGSGDGRLVIAAAKRGARALGIEYEPGLVEVSKRLAAQEGVADRAQFVKADIFESDFSRATVITMFLLPDLNLKLRPQILELAPGTRIVSNTFPMGEWTPDATAHVEGSCTNYCTALLWIVPAKVEGDWRFPGGRLALVQDFQNVSGTLASGGTGQSIQNGRLVGDRITFTAGGVEYEGRVRGSVMEGTFKSAQGSGRWGAVRGN